MNEAAGFTANADSESSRAERLRCPQGRYGLHLRYRHTRRPCPRHHHPGVSAAGRRLFRQHGSRRRNLRTVYHGVGADAVCLLAPFGRALGPFRPPPSPNPFWFRAWLRLHHHGDSAQPVLAVRRPSLVRYHLRQLRHGIRLCRRRDFARASRGSIWHGGCGLGHRLHTRPCARGRLGRNPTTVSILVRRDPIASKRELRPASAARILGLGLASRFHGREPIRLARSSSFEHIGNFSDCQG